MANEQENPLGKLATPMRIAVALAAAGHGNNEIGFRLGLSAQSVRTMLAEACKVVGVDTRSELVALAQRFGIES